MKERVGCIETAKRTDTVVVQESAGGLLLEEATPETLEACSHLAQANQLLTLLEASQKPDACGRFREQMQRVAGQISMANLPYQMAILSREVANVGLTTEKHVDYPRLGKRSGLRSWTPKTSSLFLRRVKFGLDPQPWYEAQDKSADLGAETFNLQTGVGAMAVFDCVGDRFSRNADVALAYMLGGLTNKDAETVKEISEIEKAILGLGRGSFTFGKRDGQDKMPEPHVARIYELLQNLLGDDLTDPRMFLNGGEQVQARLRERLLYEHEYLKKVSRLLEVPFRATGLIAAFTRNHLECLKWEDVHLAVCYQQGDRIFAWKTPRGNNEYFDGLVAARSNLARSRVIALDERVEHLAAEEEIINLSYLSKDAKFNHPSGEGSGVLGYKGDFESYLEPYGVDIIDNPKATLVAYTDGVALLAALAGIKQPWVLALQMHDQYQAGANKITNGVDSNNPMSTLVRYCVAQAMNGHFPLEFQNRDLIDDALSQVVQMERPIRVKIDMSELQRVEIEMSTCGYLSQESESRLGLLTEKMFPGK